MCHAYIASGTKIYETKVMNNGAANDCREAAEVHFLFPKKQNQKEMHHEAAHPLAACLQTLVPLDFSN